MEISINGHKGEGVLVVPQEDHYDFKIKAKGRLDLFTFTTCHREQTKENAGEKGWFSDKKSREFTFIPNRDLEAGHLTCPAQLGGYERKKGRHSWGLVEFEHQSLQMPARLLCNGSTSNARGVSLCQSKAGLIQEIQFTEPMLISAAGNCMKMPSKDGQKFRFLMSVGQCIFRFVTQNGEKKWHRLTTIGYEKILIRED